MHKIYPVPEICCMIGQIDRVPTVNESQASHPENRRWAGLHMCTQMSAILPKTADFMPSITANPRISNELEAILWYAWHGQLLDKRYQSPVHPPNSRSSQLSPLDSNYGRLSPTSLTNTLILRYRIADIMGIISSPWLCWFKMLQLLLLLGGKTK